MLFLQELHEEYLCGCETKWISQGIYGQEGIWRWLSQCQAIMVILGFAFLLPNCIICGRNRTSPLPWRDRTNLQMSPFAPQTPIFVSENSNLPWNYHRNRAWLVTHFAVATFWITSPHTFVHSMPVHWDRTPACPDISLLLLGPWSISSHWVRWTQSRVCFR